MSSLYLRHSRQRGFTIVELLIVIVVIAILASITVVAYNGISQRANNAARIAAVTQFQQILQVALTENSPLTLRESLNRPDTWWRACLGTGYADMDGDGKGDCARWAVSPPLYVSESAAFNTLLSRGTGALPSMSSYPKTTYSGGDVITGPYFGSAWVDSKDMLVLEYTLQGEKQDCVKRPLVYKNGSANTLTPPANPQYTTTGSGVTGCALVIVDQVN